MKRIRRWFDHHMLEHRISRHWSSRAVRSVTTLPSWRCHCTHQISILSKSAEDHFKRHSVRLFWIIRQPHNSDWYSCWSDPYTKV